MAGTKDHSPTCLPSFLMKAMEAPGEMQGCPGTWPPPPAPSPNVNVKCRQHLVHAVAGLAFRWQSFYSMQRKAAPHRCTESSVEYQRLVEETLAHVKPWPLKGVFRNVDER